MSLWKNTFWNLLGLVIPTLAALPAMALMARMLGVERFGLFMLAFSLLGYASIFDAGITRAIIRSVALNKGQLTKDRAVMGTAIWVVLLLSVSVSAFLYFGSAYIVEWLNVTPAVAGDARSAFGITAFAIPPTLLGMILFAYLEGRQQFARLNLYKMITGSLVGLLPAAFLFIAPTLVNALLGLLAARLLALVIAYVACARELGRSFFSFVPEALRELIAFGSWVTLSNFISPLMSNLDRFILSNTLGAQHVAYYTAPAEAVARMSIVPGALARAVFPLFSGNQESSLEIASRAYKGLLLATAVVALPVLAGAEMLLDVWLGQPYGSESASVLRILVIGFVFNSIAQIPFSRIQAHGHSKLTAVIHLVELGPYLMLLAGLVYLFGIQGAAMAWSLRVTADFIALEYFSRKMGV